MIISRTPLRISLGGGGTDLPSYYRNGGPGFLVAAAISKHIYVAVHENFEPSILLKYSKVERVDAVQDVEHPLIREALRFAGLGNGVEISSLADIPAGTGLGSSGSFTVGLLRAVYTYQRRFASNLDIAAAACHLEIDRLGEPVGKQDQYIAAVGGITAFEFHEDDTVTTHSVHMPDGARQLLEDNLLLFYTGVRRNASDELRALDASVEVSDADVRRNLDRVRELGYGTLATLENGEMHRFGELLTEQWRMKYERSPSPIHDQVNDWIVAGCAAGAAGGKLVGAGGGGFLLFYAENKEGLRGEMAVVGLREVPFRIDYLGTTVVVA